MISARPGLIRWVAITFVAIMLGIQLVRPERTNPPVDSSLILGAGASLDHRVVEILDRACYDCHSNSTRWPWYSNIAPVSWFVIDHVNHGRRHLNFSRWSDYSEQERSDLLREICKEIKVHAMPLSSYTLIHRNARLSRQDIDALCEWTALELNQASIAPSSSSG